MPATVEHGGERLTREEAFSLVRRAVEALAPNGDAVMAAAVRDKARELLGRDSESLGDRYFHRILRDAHDADVIDLRKRGDDYEVAASSTAPALTEQLRSAELPSATSAGTSVTPPLMRRSVRGRGRGPAPRDLPPELLSLGVVELTPSSPVPVAPPAPPAPPQAGSVEIEPAEDKPRRGRAAAKKGSRPRAKKSARTADAESNGASAPSDSAPQPTQGKASPARKRPRRPRRGAGAAGGEG
jgi:hypothetical protein